MIWSEGAVMATSTPACDCSEEYGPCEAHCIVLAQREGSSSRSADELCIVFLYDAQGIDPTCLSPYGQDVRTRAEAAIPEGWSWIEDETGVLQDELRDVVTQVETYLTPAQTYWDDGYRIVRMTDDCPLLIG